MNLDQRTFAIIIVITTVISYLIIRKFFKIAPRFLLYASLGILAGLVAGIAIAWPISKLLGEFGIVVAPYVLGIILLVFVEFFIIEGKEIVKQIGKKGLKL